MPSVHKKVIIQYWIHNAWISPTNEVCSSDTPGARFVHRRKVPKGTPGAVRTKVKSRKWYGRLPDSPKAVPLSANKVAAQQLLAELVRKSELKRANIHDPYEAHRHRPLVEHLADWEASLGVSGATRKHATQTVACVRRVFEGCQFVFLADLSASRVEQFLAELREKRCILPPLDPEKTSYTKREVAKLLGVSPSAIPALVRRRRLEATGNGKARRFPRATAEALWALRTRGRSIKTTNLYLDALKQFAAWLVLDRRAPDNPLAHLTGGNIKLDRRHDRRALTILELQATISAADTSTRVFRGLAGPDRAVLYAIACVTGFRASELAELRPSDFELNGDPATVTLAARLAKNRKTAINLCQRMSLSSCEPIWLPGQPVSQSGQEVGWTTRRRCCRPIWKQQRSPTW